MFPALDPRWVADWDLRIFAATEPILYGLWMIAWSVGIGKVVLQWRGTEDGTGVRCWLSGSPNGQVNVRRETFEFY